MYDSSDAKAGTEAIEAAHGLKRVWSVPTITDEDASLTAAIKPIYLAAEDNSITTPRGPS